MDQEQLKLAYEQIDNQILRLLLYFGSAVILALSSALTYLWHTWRADARERTEVDKITAKAIDGATNQIDNLRDQVQELSRIIAEKLAKS
ncbi:MAG: hypothetical protein JNM22_05665 [Saprospiraceae bacterium]|nr:hypothetical protein [Saprospiraceae bacterium]